MFTIDITKITCLFTIHVKVKHIHITSIIYWFLYYWVVNIQCFLWDHVWYSRGLGTKSSFKQTLLKAPLMQVWLLYIIKVMCKCVCLPKNFPHDFLHFICFSISKFASGELLDHSTEKHNLLCPLGVCL